MAKQIMLVKDGKTKKAVLSENYNYVFDKKSGYFVRWGKTKDDDTEYAPTAEIWDCEISDICSGVTCLDGKERVCPFCYKANLPTNKQNMSFETFKTIFDKVNKQKILTQIAFGADSHATSNPDLWKMMEYCRKNGVIPNITVAEISDETADKLVKYCGAVAVSVYSNHDVAYDSVKRLTDRGMSQVNIHRLIEKNSFEDTMKLIDEVKTDTRLEKLNAVVFLSLKQKGRGIHFERIEDSQFEELIKKAVDNKLGFGFDSCTATKFFDVATKIGIIDKVKDMIEPCESSLFSMYTNVKGEFYPCSFAEGQGSWKTGLDVVNCNDFIEDIWNHKRTIAFRKGLICNKASNGCRQCPFYRI